MTGLFGSRWTSQHGTSDDTGQWGQVLAGLSSAQILRGIRQVQLSGAEWPPAAPEFRRLCLGDGLGLPSFDCALAEVVSYVRKNPHERSRDTLSPAVRHTIARNLDFYAFQQLSGDEQMRAFRSAYSATQEQFSRGVRFDAPLPERSRIEPASPPVTHGDAAASRVALRALFGGG